MKKMIQISMVALVGTLCVSAKSVESHGQEISMTKCSKTQSDYYSSTGEQGEKCKMGCPVEEQNNRCNKPCPGSGKTGRKRMGAAKRVTQGETVQNNSVKGSCKSAAKKITDGTSL